MLSNIHNKDYYTDDHGKMYTIGKYGKRIYRGDGGSRGNNEDLKFEKSAPILDFAWNLFKEVTKNETNIVISPLSPQFILSFLAPESTGTTKEEIVSVTGFESSEKLEELISNIQKEPTARELLISNAIFVTDKHR